MSCRPGNADGTWGIIGAVMVVSAIAGPLIGGWLTDGPGWRWGLWMNIPLGIFAMVSAVVFMRVPKKFAVPIRMDWVGIGLLSTAITCLVLVATWGGTIYSWVSPQILSLIATTMISGTLFVLVERRAAEPVMPLALFRDRNFVVSTFAGLIIGVAMFGVDGYLPTYLQMVARVNATAAGLYMLPMLITLIAVSVGAGELVSRTGRYKWLPITGAALVAVALVLLSTTTPGLPVGAVCCYLALMGAGLGASLQILILIVQNSFPGSMVGTAMATNNYFRQIGASVGAAVVGGLFAARLADTNAGAGGRAESLTPEFVRALPDNVRATVLAGYNDALMPIFLILMPAVALAAILLFFVVEKPLATSIDDSGLPESPNPGADGVVTQIGHS
jgi:MFS family permease